MAENKLNCKHFLSWLKIYLSEWLNDLKITGIWLEFYDSKNDYPKPVLTFTKIGTKINVAADHQNGNYYTKTYDSMKDAFKVNECIICNIAKNLKNVDIQYMSNGEMQKSFTVNIDDNLASHTPHEEIEHEETPHQESTREFSPTARKSMINPTNVTGVLLLVTAIGIMLKHKR
jgi:hypothetical protein